MPFLNPAVRHLHWMCHAPQLLDSSLSVDLAPQLPPRLEEVLRRWDAAPEDGPALLTTPAPRRLGLYFEGLYDCLLRELLGWEVLARNLPIRRGGETLGELDFVVRNPATGTVEHHEIAIKFYLGYRYPQGEVLWHGPNAIDRLDLKTTHLLQQQSQRLALEATHQALRAQDVPVPALSRIFMPGYLFHPWHGADPLPLPDNVPAHHSRGAWLYRDEVEAATGTEPWVPLRKPHWLGPWLQADAPDPALGEASLADIDASNTPRLFAALSFDGQTRLWREKQRFFVVPRSWPGYTMR